MTEKYVSALWTAIAPGLANHLWQSTLVALAAGFLTVAFLNNRAQVRYWLWFSASLKFLLPISLLMGVGSHVAITMTQVWQ